LDFSLLVKSRRVEPTRAHDSGAVAERHCKEEFGRQVKNKHDYNSRARRAFGFTGDVSPARRRLSNILCALCKKLLCAFRLELGASGEKILSRRKRQELNRSALKL